jgi:hypothetical protein
VLSFYVADNTTTPNLGNFKIDGKWTKFFVFLKCRYACSLLRQGMKQIYIALRNEEGSSQDPEAVCIRLIL